MKAARRARARTAALQSLYELEARPAGVEEAIVDLTDHFSPPPMDMVYHRQLVEGVCDRRRELDEFLRSASQRWRPERFLLIDHVILRIALLELLDELAPRAVVIAEAVKLGAKYGSEDSASFINGMLETLSTKLAEQG